MSHNREAVKLQLVAASIFCLKNYVADLEILTLELFTEMSKRIYFAPKTDEDVKQLFLKYRQLHKFVCEMAVEFCKENSVHHELSFVS